MSRRRTGERVAKPEANTSYWLLTDRLGCTSIVVATTSALTGELRYKAYGDARYAWGITTTTKYHFTGQREESAIGLYFYNARWYDAALGRFTQADDLVQSSATSRTPRLPLAVSYASPSMLEQWNQLPCVEQPQGRAPGSLPVSDPQFLNRYTYARNNPLAYVDDSGQIAWSAVLGLVGGIAGFGSYAITHRDNFEWRQAVLWTVGGAVVGATLGAGAQWVAGALASTPWALPPLERGQAIEDTLGRNLPRSFPGIDRWVNGLATSIKSLDLNAVTYRNINALTGKVQGYINALADFQGAQWLQASMIRGRELLLAVPGGAGTPA
jgi:RHS repeat-associated protein